MAVVTNVYLLLLLVRGWFALSPSYLHPDENFQGPEVIAGQVFGYPVRHTWEFTSARPIRSIFPLWPVYGLPMELLHWLGIGISSDNSGNGGWTTISPMAVFWVLRSIMLMISFVLEDWAVHELVNNSLRQRRIAVLLVASSYVTWTYQTHTFSNSIETVLVAWCLVLIERIPRDAQKQSFLACALFAVLCVFGFFNRITFPAFLLIPGLQLIPYFWSRPLELLVTVSTALLTTLLAIALDTTFYTYLQSSRSPMSLRALITNPVITPLNNLRYNLNSSNLALHGIHPRYQHILANLPLLLGPAIPLMVSALFFPAHRLFLRPPAASSSPSFSPTTDKAPSLSHSPPASLGGITLLGLPSHIPMRLWAAVSGVLVLSIFQHQEARFLLPAVPLVLSSVSLPSSARWGSWARPLRRVWLGAWVFFNIVLGLLMGRYHQAGVVPTQVFVSRHALAPNVHSMPEGVIRDSASAFVTAPSFSDSRNRLEREAASSSYDHVHTHNSLVEFGPKTTAHVLWWKTYMPPTWLLGPQRPNREIVTVDLAGTSGTDMLKNLTALVDSFSCLCPSPLVSSWASSSSEAANTALDRHVVQRQRNETYLVVPAATTFMNAYVLPWSETASSSPDASAHSAQSVAQEAARELQFTEVFRYRQHINLDDLDFAADGLWPTLRRVVGERGLVVYEVCARSEKAGTGAASHYDMLRS